MRHVTLLVLVLKSVSEKAHSSNTVVKLEYAGLYFPSVIIQFE